MRWLLMFFLCCLFATETVMGTKLNDAPVLQPGSRIVAGDLTKNEFFILAANESEPKQISPAPIVTPATRNKEIVPTIKTALKQTVHVQPKTITIKQTTTSLSQKKRVRKTMHAYHTVKYIHRSSQPQIHKVIAKKSSIKKVVKQQRTWHPSVDKIKVYAVVITSAKQNKIKHQFVLKKQVALRKVIHRKQVV